jgi:D-methionine transport system substrate-binding protein
MKKSIISVLLLLTLTSGIVFSGGCSQTTAKSQTDTSAPLKIATVSVPHAELLEFVKPKLEEQGIKLDITVISEDGSSLINEQTNNGEYDVNYFQHDPYLQSVSKEKGYNLVNVGGIHVEPIGFYSTKYKSKDQIPDQATIAIPNDATNEYRALKILEQNGFIKLKSTIQNYSATIQDIETYVKPIKLVEMESSTIIRAGDQFDGYITNTNKILEAGIDANTALFREGKDSPYANILVTTPDKVDDPRIKALYKALTTEDVRKFIEEKYKGAVIPAF